MKKHIVWRFMLPFLLLFVLAFAQVYPLFAAYVGDGFCGHMASDIDYKYINAFHCQCYHCGAYRNHSYSTLGFNLLGLDPAKVHRCIYCRVAENHTFGNLSSSARCAVANAGEHCTHPIYSINGSAYDINNHICRYCGYIAPHNFGDPNIPVREIRCICGYVCPHSFNAGNADGSTHTCSICHFKFLHNFVSKADGSGCVCSDCGYTVAHSFVNQGDGTHKCSVCDYTELHDDWDPLFATRSEHVCGDCGEGESHTFVNGVCTACGYHCSHTFDIRTGICMTCDYNMYDPHNNSTCQDKANHNCAQACPECGLILPHNFVDQGNDTHKCSNCDLIQAHHNAVFYGDLFTSLGDSKQHECSDCGRLENHTYVDNICPVCGITDAPTVVSHMPSGTNVSVNTNELRIKFSEVMDLYALIPRDLQYSLSYEPEDDLSPANVGISPHNWNLTDTTSGERGCIFTFALPDGLKYNTTYTFSVSGFKDGTDCESNGGTLMVPASFSFTTEKNSDAALSGLTVSEGVLSPDLDPGTAVYEVNVPNSTTELTVTPTVRGTGATVTVNGNTVASGSASNSIPLSPGDNPVNVTVTAQDETATKMYTVWVNRTPDADAALSSLIISQGTLSPAFASGIYDYSVSVGAGIDSLTVTPAASGVGATVTVNGNAVASGTMSAPITLVPGANLVCISVVAQDGKTEEDYTIIVSVAYTVTFNSNGSVYATKTVNAGESIGSAAWPANPTRNSYAFGGWFTGENGSGTQFISATPVNATTTVYAKWTYRGGSGSPTPFPPATSTYNADVKAGNDSEIALPVTVDKDGGTASVDAGSKSVTQAGTVITVPSIPAVNTYTARIPILELSTSDAQGTLTFNTDTGSITVPSNMLAGVSEISGSKAEISIGQGDKDNLPEDVRAAIGDKPLIQLTLSIDGKQTEWNNPDAPVTVSIPYTPTAEERADPDHIKVWYIDGTGNAVEVPDGRYDPATGTVVFTTTHFSYFAVVYAPVPAAAKQVIVLTLGQREAAVDGSPYLLDGAPFAVVGRTMVPLRFVSEALGAYVEWNDATGQVTIKAGDREIILTIGSTNVFINGQPAAIDSAPAVLPPGRTFVPLRFVGETLGAQVDYDDATGVITITR